MATHDPLISPGDGIRDLPNDSVSCLIVFGWSAQGRFCGTECMGTSSKASRCCGNDNKSAKHKSRCISFVVLALFGAINAIVNAANKADQSPMDVKFPLFDR